MVLFDILIPVSAKSKSSWKNASRFLSYYLPSLLEEFEIQPCGRIMPGPFIVNLLEENSSKQSHSATIDEIYNFIKGELKLEKAIKDSQLDALLDNLFPNNKNKSGYPNFDDSEKTPTLSDSKSITTFDLQKKENFKDLPDKSKREFYNLTKAIFPLIDKVID